VSQFCRDHRISRQTFYKWRSRFSQEGLAGLEERSRRPLSSPGQTTAAVEQAVLRTRMQLLEAGHDYGPEAIVWAMKRQDQQAPSRTTVWRILTRHAVIVPQPQKRPKSATKRFCFHRPNECWQSDWTQWALADDTVTAICGTLDDHSRYLPALWAGIGHGTAELVWSTMVAGIAECGVPAMSLTDNGLAYTGRRKGFEASFEANLRALGTRTINSRPFHPQTCGKIERFWQTLKKWLHAQPAAASIDELNDQLAYFRDFYNHHRPHRALRGATPAEIYTASAKAHPAEYALAAPVFVSRHTVDERSGNIHVPPYRIGVGVRWGGHVCDVIRQGDHIAIFSATTLIRELTADPTRYHQRCESNTRTYRIREPKPAP
ncbi:IS481 family transposase, partial [Mycolicibacterium flavescens]